MCCHDGNFPARWPDLGLPVISRLEQRSVVALPGLWLRQRPAGGCVMSATKASDPNIRPPRGRKLIAVVHADMVGYSRLIGLDDVGTLERLRSLRSSLIDPAIDEHGGRLVNTGGDSLLIVFDSVDGAVRCAVKVQQQVPPRWRSAP